MAEFLYQIIDKNGKNKKGSIEADSPERARAMLKAEGSIVMKLDEASLLNKDLSFHGIKKKIKSRDLAVFCKQLKSILHAGISIIPALEMFRHRQTIRDCRNPLRM